MGRLINIVYLILNNRYFGHDYYKGCFSKTTFKPIYFEYYAESLKQCYERESVGELTLENIIPLPVPYANKVSEELLSNTTLSF